VVGQNVAVGTDKHALVWQSNPIQSGEWPVMIDAAYHRISCSGCATYYLPEVVTAATHDWVSLMQIDARARSLRASQVSSLAGFVFCNTTHTGHALLRVGSSLLGVESRENS